jgi:hypothetical protein
VVRVEPPLALWGDGGDLLGTAGGVPIDPDLSGRGAKAALPSSGLSWSFFRRLGKNLFRSQPIHSAICSSLSRTVRSARCRFSAISPVYSGLNVYSPLTVIVQPPARKFWTVPVSFTISVALLITLGVVLNLNVPPNVVKLARPPMN